MKFRFYRAFTLIELLIVIVIIGILATALIPRLQGVQQKARYTRVESDFKILREVSFIAQTNTNKTIKEFTNMGQSSASCTSSGSWLSGLSSLPPSHACRTAWVTTLRRIEVAAGMSTGSLSSLETDPRGSPYLMDQNEGEHGSDGCTHKDGVFTAGPDGNPSTTSDNKSLLIPPVYCPGAY